MLGPGKLKNPAAVTLGKLGGRPKGPKLTCWCGEQFTASDLRKHMPHCPKRPAPKGGEYEECA